MKSKIVLIILMLMTLAMFGCSSNETNYVENNPDNSSGSSSSGLSGLVRIPVLFSVAETVPAVEAQYKQNDGTGTSSLYLINSIDGSATLIGDIGYRVRAIAYDFVTNKLYGITGGQRELPHLTNDTYIGGSQLIEICMITGHGTPIGTGTGVENDCLTFNSYGTLFSLTGTPYNSTCTVDLKTGIATCIPYSGAFGSYPGLAFDNNDVLYLVVNYHGARVYMIDPTTGDNTDKGAISGLPYGLAYHGDFNPLTGKYWGLDALDNQTFARNLLVVDINNLTLNKTIPTVDNLEAITFGYMDVNTLTLLGLTDLIDYLNPEQPINNF